MKNIKSGFCNFLLILLHNAEEFLLEKMNFSTITIDDKEEINVNIRIHLASVIANIYYRVDRKIKSLFTISRINCGFI